MMKETCPICNGTGQISFFKGVSRFLLSCEECPECGGLGFLPAGDSGKNPAPSRRPAARRKQRGSR